MALEKGGTLGPLAARGKPDLAAGPPGCLGAVKVAWASDPIAGGGGRGAAVRARPRDGQGGLVILLLDQEELARGE